MEWDADALRDIVRDYVIASCGVARQYTGSAGKITNCQIGVFAAYVSRHGHAFIDRTLYLPKEWTDDPDRLEAAYVPAHAGFATKPKLATRMIARAIAASVPFKWVAGDAAANGAASVADLRAPLLAHTRWWCSMPQHQPAGRAESC
jgi:SRSO17 transposase